VATAEEKQAYADEVAAAQEEAAQAVFEPINPDITESEWELMNLRRGVDDANRLFEIVAQHGAPNIVADPEPPPEETGEGETLPDEPNQELPSGTSRKKG
jgi:hypothetical protein